MEEEGIGKEEGIG